MEIKKQGINIPIEAVQNALIMPSPFAKLDYLEQKKLFIRIII